MADKLSDLLAPERVRGIWRRQVVDPVVTGKVESGGGTVLENVGTAVQTDVERLATRTARETPQQVLRQLQSELQAQLGERYLLLGHLLHPLGTAIERAQSKGMAATLHPLAHAANDSVPRLIDRLDDAVTAMLRVERRVLRLLDRLW